MPRRCLGVLENPLLPEEGWRKAPGWWEKPSRSPRPLRPVVLPSFATSASFATRRKELPPPPQRRCDPSSGRRELSTHDSAFGTDDWRLTAGVWRLAQR
jgi:hypothetical protein